MLIEVLRSHCRDIGFWHGVFSSARLQIPEKRAPCRNPKRSEKVEVVLAFLGEEAETSCVTLFALLFLEVGWLDASVFVSSDYLLQEVSERGGHRACKVALLVPFPFPGCNPEEEYERGFQMHFGPLVGPLAPISEAWQSEPYVGLRAGSRLLSSQVCV